MKIRDVIRALQNHIPFASHLFTDNLKITNIEKTGDFLNVTTSEPHGLKPNDAIILTSVKNKLVISSFDQDAAGLSATLKFSQNHGLTVDPLNPQSVFLTDHDDPANDKEYLLVDVPDQKTIVIDTRGQILEPGLSILVDEGFNGLYTIGDVPSETTVTIPARTDIYTKPAIAVGGELKTRLRISGAADVERFAAAYTKQETKECWLVVTAPTNRTSKSRSVNTDAVAAVYDDSGYIAPVDVRLYLLETISIYLFVPATKEIAGRLAVDIAEECRWAVYASLCGANIPSQSKSNEVTALMPTNDGYYAYLDGNTSYVHQFEFERTVTLVRDDLVPDTLPDAPFVDVDITIEPCDCFKWVDKNTH